MRRCPFLTGLLTAILGATPLVGLETGFKEGELFPDLALPSMADGRPLSVSSFRGKKVLLIVFASW